MGRHSGTGGEGATYLNVSCGNFVNKKKNISDWGYTGRLIKIEKKQDEYQGQKYFKVMATMQDDSGETVIIQFRMKSWFAVNFFSLIHRVNLDKPFLLGCSGSEQNEKASFCWISQDGNSFMPTSGEIEATGRKSMKKDPAFPKPMPETDEEGNKRSSYKDVLPTMDRAIEHIRGKLGNTGTAHAPVDESFQDLPAQDEQPPHPADGGGFQEEDLNSLPF